MSEQVITDPAGTAVPMPLDWDGVPAEPVDVAGLPADPDAVLGSLAGLRAGLAAGKWSPEAVIEAVLARRRTGDPAWIDLVPAAELRREAARLVAEGPRGRPLWGVPVAVKGNLDVAALPTTAGCPGFATDPAAGHAEVVARLVAAGAVVVGTTNLDQFATGLVGTRTPYGVCEAVGHPGWIAGGSSSGSAVVVARGDVPVALGTDTAGSGRVPAALNGVAALKPTRGRFSTTGLVPACHSLDCVSLMAATPAAAALVAAVVGGLDPTDPWSRSDLPGAGWWRPLRRPPRVAVPRPDQRWFAGDAAAEDADDAARRRMVDLGWTLVEVDVEPLLAAGRLLYGGAFVAERVLVVGEALARADAGDPAVVLDPTVAGIVRRAESLPAWQVFADEARLLALAGPADALFGGVDALALPVVPTTFTVAAVAEDPVARNNVLGTYTTFANLLDLCAAVAPVAPRVDGHPWGVQLLAPAFDDGVVAALAQELQVRPDREAAELRVPAVASPSPAQPVFANLPGQTVEAGWDLPPGTVPLVAAGAHLRGEVLEYQVRDHDGVFVTTARTAPRYRMHLVALDPPRPGLVRVEVGGSGLEVDIWALPPEGWAAFVAAAPHRLAVGRLEMADGTYLPGFLAAADRAAGTTDLSAFGGWRGWKAAGCPGL